ncbi:MAG: hypothetical protein IJK66_00200 [Bacilli bacterium]|nr:hypothetical protein [Bacilli bacterium]
MKSLGIFKDSKDGTIKSVFKVEKGIIEMSLINTKEDMDMLCVPTHHFCNMGCKMCHLTNNKLNKKMIPININDFLNGLVKSVSDIRGFRRTKKKKLLISFMGVGEPLLNLELIEKVYKSEYYIKERLGYDDVSYALASMMPNDNILKLIELVNSINMPLKIHFSLHNPIDSKRKELIPNTKVSVEDALGYLVNYRNIIQSNKIIMNKYIKFHRTNDPVEIHYTLIDDINDSNEELNVMINLLKKYEIPIKFLKFNPTNKMLISKNEDIWLKKIKKEIPNLRVKTYSPPGKEVGSSCGEFTKHYYHEEIESKEDKLEFENWVKKYQIFD